MSRDLNASLSAVIDYSCTSSSTPLYQSAHDIEAPSFADSKDMIGAKFK